MRTFRALLRPCARPVTQRSARALATRALTQRPGRHLAARALSYPAHEVVGLPALSPTMEVGTIQKWHVEEGASFGEGDTICEIETDKATIDFTAQDEGVVARLLQPRGTRSPSARRSWSRSRTPRTPEPSRTSRRRPPRRRRRGAARGGGGRAGGAGAGRGRARRRGPRGEPRRAAHAGGGFYEPVSKHRRERSGRLGQGRPHHEGRRLGGARGGHGLPGARCLGVDDDGSGGAGTGNHRAGRALPAPTSNTLRPLHHTDERRSLRRCTSDDDAQGHRQALDGVAKGFVHTLLASRAKPTWLVWPSCGSTS